MQTLPSSETLLLASNSPPLRNHHGGDDVDIDFGDVFGGPPKRRSKVNSNNEATRQSFNEAALRRRDVIFDDGSLIPRDDDKPVFGEEPSIRRRFTTDDFFDDIFRVNEKKNETFGSGSGSSLPGSRILSPVIKAESSPGSSFPTQFSLPAKLMKATEIPTFGSTRSTIASSSPLSRSSSKVDYGVKSDLDDDYGVAKEVVNGKGRQFHFSIYKWPNKGVPVVIWGSSRLSSMAKAEETITPSYSWSTPVEKGGKDDGLYGLKEETKTADKRPVVQTEIGLMPEQAVSGDLSKAQDVNLKPIRSFIDDKDNKQGEDIVLEKEVKKGKSKAKNTQSSVGDSRSKKKPQGRRSSLDSPRPEKSSFASSSLASEVGKDGVKGKVMDFVKIFSQGPSIGAGGESLGQSSRWRAKEIPETSINKNGAKDKETVNIPDQLKKPTPDIPAMARDQKPSQPTQKKDSERESVNIKKPSQPTPKKDSERESVNIKEPSQPRQKKDSERERVNIKKASNVTEQEERQEPSTAYTTAEDINEPIHVNFEVEDITQDEIKLEESRNEAEEIQNIDAKIRKWSSGKSGNIRSLLSTLQYILWSGSGWKAVPLMDMIEGNAVRKSYQRALLILHPDKLQQKGASDNQKYMAEKVFELLQEAWDHFNTLGPV
ncbi:hypothetical protein AALP_AA2G192800 [Arabis alpina]|uniref:J domain-containing protein n=1 Tax=Arabis alpina TaxID=50452 RepID=A0A087HIJ7_ARAAL|nr:hypothetical protein AALP_AA2G192800 [Arabis alpina]